MTTSSGRQPGGRTLSYATVVDLSHVLRPGIPLWPGDPAVLFEDVADLEKDGFTLRRFSMGEHSATHMNAPAAFHPGGATIDSYEPEGLVSTAIVIDVRALASTNADYALTRRDVEEWERVYGAVTAGSVVLLRTGWQEKWFRYWPSFPNLGEPDRYFGSDGSGIPHFPGFGLDAALYLISDRRAAGLGIDTHGLEPGAANGYPVNSLVLERPRLALENLTNLDRVPPTGATIVVGILRLEGGSGSPVSVLAFLP